MIFDLRIAKDVWKQMLRMALLMLALLGSGQASAGYYICQGNGGVGEIAVAYGSTCPFGGMRIYKLSEPVAFHKLSSGGAIDFAPSSEILDFGGVDLNNRSAAQTIRVTNTADASLSIASTPTASKGFVVDASRSAAAAASTTANCPRITALRGNGVGSKGWEAVNITSITTLPANIHSR